MLKVMTLNLWRYHDWDKRVENIIRLIKTEAPDCIAFQEVLTNHSFSSTPSIYYIADRCGYEHRSFTPTLARNNSKDRYGNRTQRASEGQAFISRFPIVQSEGYFLKYYSEYPEEKTVQFCRIKTDGDLIDFCNVHFANSEVAYLHLDELLLLAEKRGLAPIILGDFNIYRLAQYKNTNTRLEDFTLSSDRLDYVSFPEDKESLDYIAAHNSRYKMGKVKCLDTYVSDHRALIANISRV